MKLLRSLAIAVVALLLVGATLAALLPRAWHVEHAVVIHASPERILPFLVTPRRWQDWSIWSRELDPQVRQSYEGPEQGVGARWSWLGPKMGRGRMELIELTTSTVTFAESLESDTVNGHATLTLNPEGDATRVMWTDEGTLPVLGGPFRGGFEQTLGAGIAQSLERLRAHVEALPPPPAPQPLPPAPDAGSVQQ